MRFATTSSPSASSEDMAAEQKARAVYENLIDLTDDNDVIGHLLWLRQREIVHYARFKELFEEYEKKYNNPKQMLFNNNVNDIIVNNLDFNNYENMLLR